jgi:hypothetical protein
MKGGLDGREEAEKKKKHEDMVGRVDFRGRR